MVSTVEPGFDGPEVLLFSPLMSLRVESCGCAILASPWEHPQRELSSHVLLLGLKGSVPLFEGDRTFNLLPNRLSVLRAGIPHGGAGKISSTARYLWVHFTSPFQMVHSLAQIGPELDEGAIAARFADLPSDSPVIRLFHNLLAEGEKHPHTSWKVRVRFLDLLMAITETHIPAIQEKEGLPRVVYRVRSLIAEGLTDPNLSLKSMAANEGLNPDYVSRRFKFEMGVSVGDYISKMRIEKAKALLEKTSSPVNRVAQACGFGTDRRFLRQFKKVVGCPPGEYRQSRVAIHMNLH